MIKYPMNLQTILKHKKSLFNTVFFDWDGCLANTTNTWKDVVIEGLKMRNITGFTEEEVIKHTIIKFENVSKFGITDPKEFGEFLHELMLQRMETVTLNDFARELLHVCKKQGLNTILITTSGRRAIDFALQQLNIADLFTHTITFDDVTHQKPDPEGIYKGLELVQAKPTNALIVGDTRNDILAGKAAGITTVLYYPLHHEEFYDKDHLLALNADYYIRDLREILPLLSL